MSVLLIPDEKQRESDREEVWICEKNRLWSTTPRHGCIGSTSGAHANCGWVVRHGD